MEQINNSLENISPVALKSFIKRLCIVSKKHAERENARDELGNQIDKIKKIVLKKDVKKKNIEDELVLLEEKVSEVLEKEKQLMSRGSDQALIHFLKNKINDLENKNQNKINDINNSILELKEKVELLMEKSS